MHPGRPGTCSTRPEEATHLAAFFLLPLTTPFRHDPAGGLCPPAAAKRLAETEEQETKTERGQRSQRQTHKEADGSDPSQMHPSETQATPGSI